jgi:hypothetical protein
MRLLNLLLISLCLACSTAQALTEYGFDALTQGELEKLHKSLTGRVLLIPGTLPWRSIRIVGKFENSDQAAEFYYQCLASCGYEIVSTGPFDRLRDAPQASAFAAVSGPASMAPASAPSAIVAVPEKRKTRVITIAAELGALSLGRRYQSGVDFLAALDDLTASNVGSGFVLGHGISGGLKTVRLTSSGRPLSAYIKALDSDSDYKSLARPRMQVLEAETGSIATGQSVAVPSQTLTTGNGAAGASTSSSIQYKNVQLSMEITPEIMDDGRILLRIVQSDDSISGTQVISGNTVPTIASQTFSTTTIVRPYETVALGGINVERDTKSTKGPRGLARIPFLGRLFRVDQSEREKSELVIFVTAWMESPTGNSSGKQ